MRFRGQPGPDQGLRVLSEAELALRRARLEATLPADELPTLPPERALCREKLRRARYPVSLGLEARDPADRHAAVERWPKRTGSGSDSLDVPQDQNRLP